ncbi:MAG: hypothetical protein HYV97_02350 [Bdellovibrio sp.]|nr:hypothetical protein [Bdellovibrio sp.]
MALQLIRPESVRQDLRGLTLWFSEGERNLLVVHDERGVIFFEYIDTQKMIEGGRDLSLKVGEIGGSRTPLSYLRRSRVIAYKSIVKGELLNDLKNEIEKCQGMPSYIQQTLKSYLGGESKSLDFATPLQDYHPLRTSHVLSRAMAPLYRYRMFQWLNGWFLPVIVGIVIGAISLQVLYNYYTRYDPIRQCYKRGYFTDCAETLRRSMVSQEKKQEWPENALQNVLLACKNGSHPEGCGLIYDYLKNKPHDEWVKKFIAPECRPQSLTNACHLWSQFLSDEQKPFESMLAQVLQCQYFRSLVVNKLAVETLPLNLLHDLRECQKSVVFDADQMVLGHPMYISRLENLCSKGQICAPLLASAMGSSGQKKVLAMLVKSCQEYQDDQCILLACFLPTDENVQAFRPKSVLFWKDGVGEKTVVSKAIPQFYQTLTTAEQNDARKNWERECGAGDIRSCFHSTATSEEKDFRHNVKKFCGMLPEYLKKAAFVDLLTLRLSLKLSGE